MTRWGALPLDIPIDIDRETARQRAIEELAKAKYGGLPAWVEDGLNRIFELLTRLIEMLVRLTMGRVGTGAGGFNWAFLVVMLLIVAVVAFVIWRIGLPRWRRRRQDAELDLDPTREAADYRQLAEAAAAAGDWRAAVRDRYRAIIRDLEVRTILQVRPARTAWEAARLAGRYLPTAQPALFTGAAIFNEVLYGDKRADADDYRQLTEVDQVVLAAADQEDLADEDVVDEEVPTS